MPWARRRGIHQGEEDLRHGDLERRPQGRQGHVSTQSGALSEQPYGFNTRFEDKPGTNPEEQIGAALASCYAMALSLFLGEHDLKADKIDAHADVFLEPDGEGFSVKTIDLKVSAKIPGVDEVKFHEVAEQTKANAQSPSCSRRRSTWTPSWPDRPLTGILLQSGRNFAFRPAQCYRTAATLRRSINDL